MNPSAHEEGNKYSLTIVVKVFIRSYHFACILLMFTAFVQLTSHLWQKGEEFYL